MTCENTSTLTCHSYLVTGRLNCLPLHGFLIYRDMTIPQSILCIRLTAYSSKHWKQKLSVQDARKVRIIFTGFWQDGSHQYNLTNSRSVSGILGAHYFQFQAELSKLEVSTELSLPLSSNYLTGKTGVTPTRRSLIPQCKALSFLLMQ